MNINDSIDLMQVLIEERQAVMLVGPPGVGKTDGVNQLALRCMRDTVFFDAHLMDPTDAKGLPVPSGDEVRWIPPAFLPVKGKVKGPGIIFVDELDKAPPLMKAALLRGILEHKLGDVELSPDWSWVAAGNREEDQAGSGRLPSALRDRFFFIDVDLDHEAWHTWALANNIIPEVRGAIRWKPSLLMYDYTKGAPTQRSFPTPRSWEKVSRVYPNTPERLRTRMIAGKCGDGAAVEMMAFVRHYQELPDLETIIRAPKTAEVPTEADRMYALCTALAELARTLDGKRLNSIGVYAQRLPSEFATLLMRDAVAVNKSLSNAPGSREWLRENFESLRPEVASLSYRTHMW